MSKLWILPGALLAVLVLPLTGRADGGSDDEFPVSTIPSILSSYGQAYDPDRGLLYNVSSFNVIAVIDARTHRYLRVIDLSTSGAVICSGMALAQGKLYVEAYPKIVVVDLESEEVVTTIEQPVGIGSTYGELVVSDDESRVYGVIGSSHSITVLDPRTDVVLGTVQVGPDYNALALSRDGGRLYATNKETSTLALIDTETLSVERTVRVSPDQNFADFPLQIAVAPNGNVFVNYVHRTEGGKVAAFNAQGDRLATHSLPGTSTGIAASPGGEWLITGGGDILSIADGSLIARSPVPANGISTVLFPHGDQAFITNMNRRYLSVVGGFNPQLSVVGDGRVGAGQTIRLDLDVESEGGRAYVLCASLGNEQGIPLQNGRRFPIDVDSVFHRSRNAQDPAFRRFAGTLNNSGAATAELTLTPALRQMAPPGTTIYLAFATFGGSGVSRMNVREISNVIAVTVER